MSDSPTQEQRPETTRQGSSGYGYGPSYSYGMPGTESGMFGSLHPVRLLRVLRRKWKTVAIALIFAFAAAEVYLWSTPKIYRTASMIEMSLRRPRIMNQQGAVIEDTGYSPSEEVFNTRLRKFNGEALRDLAFVRFQALYKPAYAMTTNELRGLMGGVSFVLLSKTRIVQISCQHTDPRLAAASANAYAEAAEQYSLEENKIASDNAVAWLQVQAESQRQELEKGEERIVAFRMSNRVDVLESEKKSLEDAALTLQRSLVNTESQATLSRDIVNALKRVELTPADIGKLPDAAPQQEAIRLSAERWNAAVGERNALLTRFTAKHPQVAAKDKEIEILQARVLDAIRDARQTAESNLDLLLKQSETLRNKTLEQTRRAAELERQVVEVGSRLISLERERDASDISYRGILNRIEEARLSADENTATVKVVERAGPPAAPFTPNPRQALPMAMSLGLLVGLGLALLTDTLEDRVANTTDIEQGIGLKIIGLIPHIPSAKRADLATAGLNARLGQLVEAFAGVRSLLESARNATIDHSMIVVASSAPEEGKTITACNLAVSYAKAGQRTLLIDLDLRRPRLGRIFAMPESALSLLHVLGGREMSAIDRLPFPTALERLHVIASRASGDYSPAEIMGDQALVDFLAWAKQNYDRIIIDSPPCGVVSDAVVLARLAGCAIVVCRPDVSRKRSMRYTVQQFEEVGARVLGAVVNDVDFRRNVYFSNYDHHYSYSRYKYSYAADTKADDNK